MRYRARARQELRGKSLLGEFDVRGTHACCVRRLSSGMRPGWRRRGANATLHVLSLAEGLDERGLALMPLRHLATALRQRFGPQPGAGRSSGGGHRSSSRRRQQQAGDDEGSGFDAIYDVDGGDERGAHRPYRAARGSTSRSRGSLLLFRC